MKTQLSFIELHNPLFMVGCNLGVKINAAQRGCILELDTEQGLVWINFKGKKSFIPLANVASGDIKPEEVAQPIEDPRAPPAIARARRGRPPMNQEQPVSMPAFDPNNDAAAQAHREAVRAASRNAFVPPPNTTDEQIVENNRAIAMGLKKHLPLTSGLAKPVDQPALQGKPKIISHEQLQAKLDAEKEK